MDLKFGNNSSRRDFGLDNIVDHATSCCIIMPEHCINITMRGEARLIGPGLPGPGAADIEFRTQQAARCEGRRKDPYRGI